MSGAKDNFFLLFLHIYLYICNILHTEVIFDIKTSMYFAAINNNYKCEIPQILHISIIFKLIDMKSSVFAKHSIRMST